MANGYIHGKADFSWWMTQIRMGIQYRKKTAHESKWQAWRQYYRGDWNDNTLPSNVVFRMLRATVPRVYFRNPNVSIVSRRSGPDGLARARILERVDNNLLRRMKIKNHLKGMVQDTFMFGTGVGKLGYGSEYSPTPEVITTEDPTEKGKGDYNIEYNSLVIPNMPWFMRVPTGSFIVPANCIDRESARWMAHWVRRPYEDVVNDPRLKHVRGLSPTSSTNSDLGIVHSRKEGEEHMVDLIEIRDKKARQVIVIAPYLSDKILFQGDDELQIAGDIPFFTSVYNPDDEHFWGIADMKIIEPQQLELNEINTSIMYHRRMSIVKILIQEGGMTEPEAAKLISEDPHAVIFTKENPELAVKIMQASQIPQDLFTAKENIFADIRENLGFSRNESGEYQGGSRKPTATEVGVVKNASDIRVNERRDVMADVLVDVVSSMHQIVFEHWGEEQIIDVAGPDGAPVWVRFKGEMLKSGSYEVSVDPDTGLPDTRESRRLNAVEEYNLLKDNPLIDPEKLTRFLLNEMGDTAYDSMLKTANPMAPGGQQNPIDFQDYQKQMAGGG